jgi:hypothetical protein
MSDKIKLKYVLFNGDDRRARRPSDFPDCDFDERSIPPTANRFPKVVPRSTFCPTGRRTGSICGRASP